MLLCCLAIGDVEFAQFRFDEAVNSFLQSPAFRPSTNDVMNGRAGSAVECSKVTDGHFIRCQSYAK